MLLSLEIILCEGVGCVSVFRLRLAYVTKLHSYVRQSRCNERVREVLCTVRKRELHTGGADGDAGLRTMTMTLSLAY